MKQEMQISQILKSLIPKNEEELSVLRFVLRCAQLIHKGVHKAAVTEVPVAEFDIRHFIEGIPEESKKYLHGLIEAIDIYHSIYGQHISVDQLTVSDKAVYELKQIRDMCLEEGLRSIY